jgi:hypothetical protein
VLAFVICFDQNPIPNQEILISFREMDVQNRGFLDYDDVRRGMDEDATEEEVDDMMSKCATADGKVFFEAFASTFFEAEEASKLSHRYQQWLNPDEDELDDEYVEPPPSISPPSRLWSFALMKDRSDASRALPLWSETPTSYLAFCESCFSTRDLGKIKEVSH